MKIGGAPAPVREIESAQTEARRRLATATPDSLPFMELLSLASTVSTAKKTPAIGAPNPAATQETGRVTGAPKGFQSMPGLRSHDMANSFRDRSLDAPPARPYFVAGPLTLLPLHTSVTFAFTTSQLRLGGQALCPHLR